MSSFFIKSASVLLSFFFYFFLPIALKRRYRKWRKKIRLVQHIIYFLEKKWLKDLLNCFTTSLGLLTVIYGPINYGSWKFHELPRINENTKILKWLIADENLYMTDWFLSYIPNLTLELAKFDLSNP